MLEALLPSSEHCRPCRCAHHHAFQINLCTSHVLSPLFVAGPAVGKAARGAHQKCTDWARGQNGGALMCVKGCGFACQEVPMSKRVCVCLCVAM